MQPCGALGVLGGTFDPIHLGHLILGEQVREQLGLDRVLFVPSARPPHKLGDRIADAEHRLAMVELAVTSNPHFAVSRRELDRVGPSYTITTIKELRSQGHGQVYFVLGADAVLDLRSWREPDELLRACQVVAAARPGFDLSRISRALGAERASRVRVLDIPQIEISSTDLRQRVAAGRSLRYLVPDAVGDYIAEKGLYRVCADRDS